MGIQATGPVIGRLFDLQIFAWVVFGTDRYDFDQVITGQAKMDSRAIILETKESAQNDRFVKYVMQPA